MINLAWNYWSQRWVLYHIW